MVNHCRKLLSPKHIVVCCNIEHLFINVLVTDYRFWEEVSLSCFSILAVA